MANVIKLKKSIVAGNIPTTANLALGEGAINHTDQKIYFRHPGTGVVWNFAGGSITTGPVDNSILRADGTSGATLQNSGLIVEDAIVSFAVSGLSATDTITATGSAFANGQPVRFTTLTGGNGLNTTTNYYVINVSGDTFQVSTSVGGAASLFTTNIVFISTLVNGHNTQPFVAVSENTTETNSALVLTPKGTGALIAGPKPDGTVVGGNARGAGAVDLSRVRSTATEVASGADSFSAGRRATASGTNSISIGNTVASSATNSIAIGFVNTSSGDASFTGGGRTNLASGDCAAVVGGGISTTTTDGNRAMASASATIGGNRALADRIGMQAHAMGQFAAIGDAQRARFVMRNKTTTNSAIELFLDGSATRLGIPSGKVLGLTINITGISSTGAAVAHYLRQYALKNVAGTTTEVYAPITIGTDNAAGTSIALSASDASDSLIVSVTGTAATIWRWVASVDAVEIAYGV